MQADQHGRPAEPGQQSGQWGSVWIAARWRRRSLGEGGVAGGDAGAGHVNKFGMGADLISVAGFGCSGSDRRCVLVHRPVFRLGPGGVPGQCVSGLGPGPVRACALRVSVSIQLTTGN